MTAKFTDVQLLKFTEQDGSTLGCSKQSETLMNIILNSHQNVLILTFGEKDQEYTRLPLSSLTCCQLTERSLALRPNMSDCNANSLILQFPCTTDSSSFRKILRDVQKVQKNGMDGSVFDQRTEESSAVQYFQFYGYLSQQQNMLQDYVRTATYQRAILANLGDFKDKVILDVGAGSGILSFFAVQAGAKRVYAVEASSMAQHCEALVRANGCTDRVLVIPGKIEDISLPEQVDLIISEPMGYMLVNERMLESFLHAKKFLKPGGKMYPSRGDLHLAPFMDESLYLEQNSKAGFWCQESFHGVNLTFLRPQALKEYLRQPIVDTWHIGILMARSHCWSVDFLRAKEEDLHRIEIPFKFTLQTTGHMHGLAFWFDVAFVGCSQTVWLSTSPTEPLTHWYQVRCLLDRPILGKAGQQCTGKVLLKANTKQSYDVDLEATVEGRRGSNSLDLKNPYFRYTGQAVVPPPGQQQGSTSPTENYWNVAMQQVSDSNASGYSTMMNGGTPYSSLANPLLQSGGSGGGANSANNSFMSGTASLQQQSGQNFDFLTAAQQAAFSSASRPQGMGGQMMGADGRVEQSNPGVGLVTSLPLKIHSTQQQQTHTLPFSSPRYPQHVLQQQVAGGNRTGSSSPLSNRTPPPDSLGLGGGLLSSSGGLSGQPNPWTAVLPSSSNG